MRVDFVALPPDPAPLEKIKMRTIVGRSRGSTADSDTEKAAIVKGPFSLREKAGMRVV